MRIGILSDTHNLLRAEVLESMKHCEVVLHAGDVCNEEILAQLSQYSKVIAVRGNNDTGAWADRLNEEESFELNGFRFFMKHTWLNLPSIADTADFIIVGHSHKYYCEQQGKQWIINPGSCGRRRFNYPLTWIVLVCDQGQWTIERHEIKLEA